MNERLKKHPNVLQITGLCPSFKSSLISGGETTALIAPLQENGGLREFFDKRACFEVSFGWSCLTLRFLVSSIQIEIEPIRHQQASLEPPEFLGISNRVIIAMSSLQERYSCGCSHFLQLKTSRQLK